MDLDLKYNVSEGIYSLNGIRVVLLPRGSLESIQEVVNKILGLATKSIFEEAMATITYSFLTDLISKKLIKRHGEDKMLEEIFTLFGDMGFGRLGLLNKDLNTYTVTVEKGFNSILSGTKQIPYCFEELGHLKAVFRIVLEREVTVQEERCKSTGDSDLDLFRVSTIGEKGSYTYIPSLMVGTSGGSVEKVEMIKNVNDVLINSLPTEIIPVTFFPYLFSKLRNIIGLGTYGIENSIGLDIAKLYNVFNFDTIKMKYQVDGPQILSALIGAGSVGISSTEAGEFESVDIANSFNALHVDEAVEKRCFLLSGLISGLSYRLFNNALTFKENECSAVNGKICKFVVG